MNLLTSDDRPRFLTDEGFNRRVTSGLRRAHPLIDVLTLQEAGLQQYPDTKLLEESQRLDRILLSHDVRTMSGHFYKLLSQLLPGAYLPGVLLIAQEAPIGKSIEWIAEVWEASRHVEWRNRVVKLPL